MLSPPWPHQHQAGPDRALAGLLEDLELRDDETVPGSGLVPWRQFFTALKQVSYDGCITMESLEPGVQSVAKLCCIWRKLADSAEQFATEGPTFPKDVYQQVYLGREQGA
jgi:sugar phosphate isomerase/epimerase